MSHSIQRILHNVTALDEHYVAKLSAYHIVRTQYINIHISLCIRGRLKAITCFRGVMTERNISSWLSIVVQLIQQNCCAPYKSRSKKITKT